MKMPKLAVPLSGVPVHNAELSIRSEKPAVPGHTVVREEPVVLPLEDIVAAVSRVEDGVDGIIVAQVLVVSDFIIVIVVIVVIVVVVIVVVVIVVVVIVVVVIVVVVIVVVVAVARSGPPGGSGRGGCAGVLLLAVQSLRGKVFFFFLQCPD